MQEVLSFLFLENLEKLYLSKFAFGEDVVVSLPNPLDCHCGSKKPIGYTQNGKNDNKNDNQGKACLH